MFPGYITASYLTGRLGRKKTMLIYVFVATIAGFGFANSATSSFLQTVTFISAFLAITFVTAMFVPETEGKMLT